MLLRPNDVHIGDWVYNAHHLSNMRVSPYDFFTHIHDKDGVVRLADNATPTLFRDVEPIQITGEILVKANGWDSLSDTRYVYNIGGQLGITIWYDSAEHTLCANEYNEEEEGFDRLIWLRHVHYVHQLQDALRVCGLRDLADNLKVR